MGIVAEIKRLQAEIERRGKHIEELISALAATAQTLVGSFNDIERLQAEVERQSALVSEGANINTFQAMEIERLQAALSDKQRHDDGERPHD